MKFNQAKNIINLSRILISIVCDTFESNYLSRHPNLKINKNQFTTLELLSVAGPLMVREIAEILQISKAAASKNINGLVKLNLAQRRTLPKDRRHTLVYLTNNGHQIIDNFHSEVTGKHNEITQKFSAEELSTLENLLKRFVLFCLEQESNIHLICVQCDGKILKNCSLDDDLEVCRYFHRQNNKEKTNVA